MTKNQNVYLVPQAMYFTLYKALLVSIGAD